MNIRTTRYRSTLVAAALAVGVCGAVSVATAHEHGDRDGDRHGAYARHGGQERAERPRWGYYRPAPTFRPYYREGDRYYDRAYVVPEAYYPRVYAEPPAVLYRPTPRADVGYADPNVSVMIHVPL